MQAGLIKSVAVIALGLVLPAVVIVQAYLTLGSLTDSLAQTASPAAAMSMFKEAQATVRNGNDYALFSQVYAETANQVVVTNKQIIKVAVMQIGFAAMSLGLMFVVLGINDGGGEGRFAFLKLNLDFKTASTGALVFAVGAAMATAGGVLKNEYRTVGVPQFAWGGGASQVELATLEAYRTCKAQASPEFFPTCFTRLYEKVNPEQLK
jgi:hypothetical protein